MNYSIDIKRSNRKTIAFQIKEKGVLTIRAPYHASDHEINEVIKKHESWIKKHMQLMEERQTREIIKYTKDELKRMADLAAIIIPPTVEMYAKVLGVSYGRITIRSQKTRWGSCSSKGNLNFNCLLTQVPEDVMDYVVIHELCHRLEMNHSSKFWSHVERVMPDYKAKRDWLKKNGHQFIERL